MWLVKFVGVQIAMYEAEYKTVQYNRNHSKASQNNSREKQLMKLWKNIEEYNEVSHIREIELQKNS